MYELISFFEKDNTSLLNSIELVVEENKSFHSVFDRTMIDFISALQQSQSPFPSSVTTEENFKLPEGFKSRMLSVSDELNFNLEVKGDLEKLLSKLYLSNSDTDIHISKSSEGEFIAYVSSNGTYKNILVDEEGDIEILFIPKDKSKTFNKRFYKNDGLNFSKVVSIFNDMR